MGNWFGGKGGRKAKPWMALQSLGDCWNVKQRTVTRNFKEIFFYTVQGKYVTKNYGYAKTKFSHLSTKIWFIACDWETLLKKKNCKASPSRHGTRVHINSFTNKVAL